MRRLIAAGMILSLLTASPAFAGPRGNKRGAAIAKWAAIGAAAGFGVAFLAGMSKYDQATYAEEKIWRAAWTGAAIGLGVGAAFGSTRASHGGTVSVPGRPADLQHGRNQVPLRLTGWTLRRDSFQRPASDATRVSNRRPRDQELFWEDIAPELLASCEEDKLP